MTNYVEIRSTLFQNSLTAEPGVNGFNDVCVYFS